MISEESSDTEDCNNDAENLALHNMYKLHFKCIKIDILNCNISQHSSFYCISVWWQKLAV